MTTVAQTKPNEAASLAEMGNKLAFTKKLQAVTNKIHATHNIDEIIMEVTEDIRELFEAERLTLYVLNEEKDALISKVKTGLNAFNELKLPITTASIAGYVGLHKVKLNISDVYDNAELQSIRPEIHFLKEVDKKTGFRSRQMLVFPIISQTGASLLGVVQVINTLSGLPFPAMVEEGALEIAKTLAIALNQRQVPLGHTVKTKFDHLVEDNIISSAELELAQRDARTKNKDLEDVLVESFHVKPADIGKALSAFFGVPYEPFKPDRIKPLGLLRNLKLEYVLANGWLPIDETRDEGLIILTPDPERIRSSHIVSHIFPKQTKITYKVCMNLDFANSVNLFYGVGGMSGSIDDLLSTLDDEEEGGLSLEDISAAQDNELVKLVNKIIIDAYNQGASDIHIEPYPEKGKTEVRFRKDGSLVPYIEVPPGYRNALAARIKIMSDLDISEKRRPQDGKIKFKKFGPLDIELRVATIPSSGGLEDIVMRILAAGKPIPLDKLGLSDRNSKKLKELIAKPYGLFFVCGPTGSGKTTTLHSALGYINKPETKIWTAEDPVEITQKGLRQVQINKKAGIDFAMVMRAFLRADPDVIMVGEMRDKETVATGIEASLTGHLVFATLHTNSAPESIVRLLDMGMDPFNFADALLGILAQRLAKRLCADCKQAYTPAPEELKSMLNEYCMELKSTSFWKNDPDAALNGIYQEWEKSFANEKGQFTLYRPKGCDKCNNSGYKGRVGLHELLEGTDTVKKNIQEHVRVAEMFATALEEGMRTLKQDGIEKVLQGITDLKTVRFVCIK